jgi:multidrug transporter EmrE-like cation transporter
MNEEVAVQAIATAVAVGSAATAIAIVGSMLMTKRVRVGGAVAFGLIVAGVTLLLVAAGRTG